MNIDTDRILALPTAEKLQLIELLWENLGESTEPLELSKSIRQEARRRRDEMLADPQLGERHEGIWKNIADRNG